MVDEDQITKLIEKLDLLFRLLVLNLTREEKSQSARIMKLTALKFKPAEISKMLKVPTKDVHSLLSKERKKVKKSEKG